MSHWRSRTDTKKKTKPAAELNNRNKIFKAQYETYFTGVAQTLSIIYQEIEHIFQWINRPNVNSIVFYKTWAISGNFLKIDFQRIAVSVESISYLLTSKGRRTIKER